MGFSWVATEARNGRIIADLPLFNVPSVQQTVGRYESVSGATLPVNAADAPADWLRATKKNASHLILLADNPADPAHGIPQIGYRIVRRTRDETDLIKLDMGTVESYLDCRYVGDKTYTAVGQNDIVADLINSYILDGAGGKNGIPIRVQYATAGAGTPRDRQYFDTDDKTIYSVLTDLMGVIGGPEWYIGWEWQTAPERITPVLYVGSRVGAAVPAGLGPAATFEIPGPVTSVQLVEDYTQGKGANDVMAVSTGQGSVRPQSVHQTVTAPDQPTVEYRFTPSTSIIDVATLNSHASTAVTAIGAGTNSVTMSYVAAEGPQLGVDWFLGDDVGFNIGGIDQNGNDLLPSFPGGLTGVARAVGYDLTLTNTPILTPSLISPTGAFNVG